VCAGVYIYERKSDAKRQTLLKGGTIYANVFVSVIVPLRLVRVRLRVDFLVPLSSYNF
jgi:hypothetical protein